MSLAATRCCFTIHLDNGEAAFRFSVAVGVGTARWMYILDGFTVQHNQIQITIEMTIMGPE